MIMFISGLTGCQETGQSGDTSPAAAEIRASESAPAEAPADPPAPEVVPAAAPAAIRAAAGQSAPVPEGQELELLRFGPDGAVRRVSQVVAMFNQPMVALGDYFNVPKDALVTDPPLEGDRQWLNQYTLAFIPKTPLTGSLDFTATLDPEKLPALSGAKLTEAAAIRVILPDLAIAGAYQLGTAPKDEDQALKPRWRVSFNQPPDPISFKGKAFFVYKDDRGEHQVQAAYERPQGDEVTDYIFAAAQKLPRNVPYSLVLEAGVKSLAGPKPGPRLTAASGSTFGPLAVTLDNGQSQTVDPESGLYLHFSNPVDLTELIPLISIDNGFDLSGLRAQFGLDKKEAADQAEEKSPEDEVEVVDALQDYLYIFGDFKADTEYTLTISGAAKDVFGQQLDQDLALKFRTGEYETYLRLSEDYGLLETAALPKMRLWASNIAQAKIEGYALSPEKAIALLTAADFSPDYYGDLRQAESALADLKPVTATLDVPGQAKNGRVGLTVDLKELFGDKLKNSFLYLRSAWTVPSEDSQEPPRDRHTFALLQVSDLGLAVKAGAAKSLIWVTDLVKGRSLSGVALDVRDQTGRVLWSGHSDEQGLATLPGTVELLRQSVRSDPHLFVVARTKEQMALWSVNWNDGLETWRWNIDYGDALNSEIDAENWLLNALPLYKPGETAKFKIIARHSGEGGRLLLDQASEVVTIEVRDSRDEVVVTDRAQVSSFGTISYELPISADASLGHWSVWLRRPNLTDFTYVGGFMVMTYRAPAFEIKITGQPEDAVSGQTAELNVAADYHFGAPVAGQPVQYSVSASPSDYRLPGNFSDYSVISAFRPVGEDDDSGYDDTGYGYTEPSVTVASDETNLNEDGDLVIPLSLAPAPDQQPRPRTFSAYVTVTDVDQRPVSTNTSFLVHPASVYAGLAGDRFLAEAGRPFTVKAIVADHQGVLIPDHQFTATVYRRTWQNVRRKSAGSAYEYVSRVVDEKIQTLTETSGELPRELEFTPEKPGYYWVQAEVKDDQGRINQASYSFYISGSGPVGWQMGNDDRLTLVPDKKEYQPGETARIMVQSPFSEGQGLITVEREGVRDSRVFDLTDQTPVLDVPLTEDDAPNVFVSVLLARGRIADKLDEKGLDFGKPAIRLGYTELKVPTKKDLLTVEVKPDVSQTGPGGEAEISLAVTDNLGQPYSEAEVALIAADAAVIQLAGEEAYFPEKLFHRDLPLLVQTADNLISLIGRQAWGLKGDNPGGGGGEFMAMADSGEGGVRRNFATLAWFEPGVLLDKEGRATVKIKLPENLTTFKIYAVATGHGRKTGTGQSSILVTRDLLARSALPGYAGVGDEFKAAMVVSNRGQNSGSATVTLAGENFVLVDDPAEKTVEIGPGESREVSFMVRAGSAASAKFLFTVALGADRDSVEFVIPVSPPNPLTTQASYEALEAGTRATDLALTEGLDTTRGGLSVELSPSLIGVLTEPFDWMAAYPHGCVEQSTSKGYSNLVWLRLKDRFPAKPGREDEARRNVKELLTKLTQWEQGGGYNLWPETYDWNNRSVYLTAYVLDFLLSAKEAGMELPDPSLIGRVTSFLKNSLSGDYKSWPSWYSEDAVRQTKSYVLAMLSRAGENVAAYIEVLYKDRNDLSLFELVNLIRAIHFQPTYVETRADQIKELIPLLDAHLHVTAGGIQILDNSPARPEIWSSDLRSSALALTALCETKSGSDLIPGLARGLVAGSRSGHFGTTQNNAMVLKALATYIQMMEPGKPDLTITALLGEAALAQARFTAYTDPAVSGAAPLSAIPTDKPELVYQVEGQGRAWAALKMKTAPAEPDLSGASSGGFMLSRSFAVVAPKEGEPGVDTFKRGEVVRVSVTMMVPAPRYNLFLEDRVPAGFEPINFNLADADLTLLGLVSDNEASGGQWRRFWYNHQEIRPDRVTVYADYLGAGVYTFSYLARAITPGVYLTPGPRAEEMYEPETFGRGEGQRLVVE